MRRHQQGSTSVDEGNRGGEPQVGVAPGKSTRSAAIQRKPAAAPATPSPATADGAAPGGGPALEDPFWYAPGARAGADGGAMAPAVQDRMEGFFGHSFGGVKIHEGSSEASALGAQAFTRGEELHFAPGQFAPATTTGQALLGHELAHVVQQREGRVAATVQAKGIAINDDVALEDEADRLGAAVARGEAGPGGATTPRADVRAAGPVQMNNQLLQRLGAYLGVGATVGAVALALGVSTTMLTIGLATLGLVALTWDPLQVVAALRQRFQSDPLDYDRLGPGLEQNPGGFQANPQVRGENTPVSVSQNGGLFMEMTNVGVDRGYKTPLEPSTSSDEKLHVPATPDDIGLRSNIVTGACLAHGMRNWKVARRDKLQHKQSGTALIAQRLVEAGLVEPGEVIDGRTAADYQLLARRKERVELLAAFLREMTRNMRLTVDRHPEELAFELQVVVDEIASGIFPSEQSGREITVYVLPDFKTPEEWTEFVSDLQQRFVASELPRLPLAVGDAPLTNGAVDIDGVLHGYFSYRNEAMAVDPVLGSRGFPHWIGGNSDNPNAAGGKLALDEASVL